MAKLFNETQRLMSTKNERCNLLYEKITQHLVYLVNSEDTNLYTKIKDASKAGKDHVNVSTHNAKEYSLLNELYYQTIDNNGCSIKELNNYIRSEKNRLCFDITLNYINRDHIFKKELKVSWNDPTDVKRD